MTKEKRIEREKERLELIFEDVSNEKRDVAQGLIDEASFMRVTLEDLRGHINENGTVELMPQGEYSIRRQSPEVQIYNTMIQRYNTTYKELFNLLPKEKGEIVDEEFESF